MSLRPSKAFLIAFTWICVDAAASRAVVVNELDNFTAGVEGWQVGAQAGPGAVTRITSGGPLGGSDAFLQLDAQPTTIAKLVVFNVAQWSGNYVAAGITAISMDVKNLSASQDLELRLGFGTTLAPNVGGDWLASTNSIALPASGNWTSIQFPIGAGDLTNEFSTGTYASIMSSVFAMRILHKPGSPSVYGNFVEATLGIDNVKAIGGSTPIPGDFNGVGGVTGADLTKWRGDYGPANSGSDADGDLDSDGNDFLIWQRNLGQGTAVGAVRAIPEPAAASMLMAAAMAAAIRLRTRGRS